MELLRVPWVPGAWYSCDAYGFAQVCCQYVFRHQPAAVGCVPLADRHVVQIIRHGIALNIAEVFRYAFCGGALPHLLHSQRLVIFRHELSEVAGPRMDDQELRCIVVCVNLHIVVPAAKGCDRVPYVFELVGFLECRHTAKGAYVSVCKSRLHLWRAAGVRVKPGWNRLPDALVESRKVRNGLSDLYGEHPAANVHADKVRTDFVAHLHGRPDRTALACVYVWHKPWLSALYVRHVQKHKDLPDSFRLNIVCKHFRGRVLSNKFQHFVSPFRNAIRWRSCFPVFFYLYLFGYVSLRVVFVPAPS